MPDKNGNDRACFVFPNSISWQTSPAPSSSRGKTPPVNPIILRSALMPFYQPTSILDENVHKI
ncbi:hypothetical protein LF95_19610 [Thalassospira sp. TSL5-1]|nr:hypothetical protein LF95_19610 [Thalassospira sp. TSL5-1]